MITIDISELYIYVSTDLFMSWWWGEGGKVRNDEKKKKNLSPPPKKKNYYLTRKWIVSWSPGTQMI